MKLPRCVTCHPAPVMMPPDTSPTDVRFVKGSKIVALPGGEGGGVVVVVGGGGVGVDVPAVVPATELPVVRLDVPVKGVDDGTSRLQLATNAIAVKSAAGRQTLVRVASIGVVNVGFFLSHRIYARSGKRSSPDEGIGADPCLTVYVMRKNDDSTVLARRPGKRCRLREPGCRLRCPIL